MSLQQLSANKVFGGQHLRYQHQSSVLNCSMQFAVYLPPQADLGRPLPVLYWLSGLTCTDENFMQKAGALKAAAELGLIIVAPDTSPRGEGVADDPDGAWDFGLGAGFYLNATQEPWAQHYRMMITWSMSCPALIEKHLPVPISAASAVIRWVVMAHSLLLCVSRSVINQYQLLPPFVSQVSALGVRKHSRTT